MHIVNAQVPYAERCIFIEGGTAVILPFLNVAKGTDKNTSCYELFLDTNALTNVQWFAQLPEYILNAQCHQSLVCIAGTVAL